MKAVFDRESLTLIVRFTPDDEQTSKAGSRYYAGTVRLPGGGAARVSVFGLDKPEGEDAELAALLARLRK